MPFNLPHFITIFRGSEIKMQRIHKHVETKSRRFCSVPQCVSYCTKDVSLHRFPILNERLCEKWKQALKIGKPISTYMLVCSKHFTESDFFRTSSIPAKLKRLKRGVVPSKHLPTAGCAHRNKRTLENNRHWKYCIENDETNIDVKQINLEHNYCISQIQIEEPSDSGLHDQTIDNELGLSKGLDTKEPELKEKAVPSQKLRTSRSIINIKKSNSRSRNNRRKIKNVPKEHGNDIPVLVTTNLCSDEAASTDSRRKRTKKNKLTKTVPASISTSNKGVGVARKNKFRLPKKHKRLQKILDYVDEDTKRTIRSVINNFYIKNERLSVEKILRELKEKEDIHFTKSAFQTLLQEMGFRYTTKRSSTTKLRDKNEIVHFLPFPSSCPDTLLWNEPSTSSTMDVPKTREVAVQAELSCRSVSIMCDMKRPLNMTKYITKE